MSYQPNYTDTIQRILDILRDDTELKGLIAEWRFGELPEEYNANSYPACYVTTSQRPELSRRKLGPSPALGKMPPQEIITEYWIVLVSSKATPADVQSEVYELTHKVTKILADNMQFRRARRLAKPDEEGDPDEQIDPKCASIEIDSIRRLTSQRGQMVDGMTVIIHAKTYRES